MIKLYDEDGNHLMDRTDWTVALVLQEEKVSGTGLEGEKLEGTLADWNVDGFKWSGLTPTIEPGTLSYVTVSISDFNQTKYGDIGFITGDDPYLLLFNMSPCSG